jgi:hypothetical protein
VSLDRHSLGFMPSNGAYLTAVEGVAGRPSWTLKNNRVRDAAIHQDRAVAGASPYGFGRNLLFWVRV